MFRVYGEPKLKHNPDRPEKRCERGRMLRIIRELPVSTNGVSVRICTGNERGRDGLLLLMEYIPVKAACAVFGKLHTYPVQGRRTYNVVNCIFYDVSQPRKERSGVCLLIQLIANYPIIICGFLFESGIVPVFIPLIFPQTAGMPKIRLLMVLGCYDAVLTGFPFPTRHA